jgi:hypothetical protein
MVTALFPLANICAMNYMFHRICQLSNPELVLLECSEDMVVTHSLSVSGCCSRGRGSDPSNRPPAMGLLPLRTCTARGCPRRKEIDGDSFMGIDMELTTDRPQCLGWSSKAVHEPERHDKGGILFFFYRGFLPRDIGPNSGALVPCFFFADFSTSVPYFLGKNKLETTCLPPPMSRLHAGRFQHSRRPN